MNGLKQAVIVASGRPGHLSQLTRDRPTEILLVLGKPIIIRFMDRLREAGIRDFIVVVGENDGAVASYLNSGWVPDAKVQIVLQPIQRGSTSALAAAKNYVTGPFLLAACDHLVSTEHIAALIERFTEQQSELILSVISSEGALPSLPTVTVEGDLVRSISTSATKDRGGLSTFMLYACSKLILNYTGVASNEDDELAPAIQEMLASGAKVGYVTTDWHMQLANEIDLLTMNKRVLREGRDTHILSELPASVHVTPPVRIDPQVSIGANAKLGPNVYLESGAHIGQGAVIWDSIILSNASVADEAVIHVLIVAQRLRISEEDRDDARKLPSVDPETQRRLDARRKDDPDPKA